MVSRLAIALVVAAFGCGKSDKPEIRTYRLAVPDTIGVQWPAGAKLMLDGTAIGSLEGRTIEFSLPAGEKLTRAGALTFEMPTTCGLKPLAVKHSFYTELDEDESKDYEASRAEKKSIYRGELTWTTAPTWAVVWFDNAGGKKTRVTLAGSELEVAADSQNKNVVIVAECKGARDVRIEGKFVGRLRDGTSIVDVASGGCYRLLATHRVGDKERFGTAGDPILLPGKRIFQVPAGIEHVFSVPATDNPVQAVWRVQCAAPETIVRPKRP